MRGPGRRDRRPRSVRRAAPRSIRTRRSRTSPAASWCRVSSTPTSTIRRSRAIGGLGMPLLDWLEQCALPEESKLADQMYAQAVAEEFLDGLLHSGTTSALVFGSHFAAAMDRLVRRRARAWAERHVRAGRQRPDPARGPADRHRTRARSEGARADRALARQGAAAVRRHAALLAVDVGCAAGRVRGVDGRGRSGSPRTSTRTGPRSRRSPNSSRARATTSTPTTGTVW